MWVPFCARGLPVLPSIIWLTRIVKSIYLGNGNSGNMAPIAGLPGICFLVRKPGRPGLRRQTMPGFSLPEPGVGGRRSSFPHCLRPCRRRRPKASSRIDNLIVIINGGSRPCGRAVPEASLIISLLFINAAGELGCSRVLGPCHGKSRMLPRAVAKAALTRREV
jgi:hypothetical protein